jgi:chemotaxis protein histidine kinase CheA
MMMKDELRIGSNNPPIKERLEMEYPEIFGRLNQLLDEAKSVPEKIDNEADASKAQDLVKMMRVAIKQADATRDAEKEPYAQAVKEVNATFKMPMEKLDAAMKGIISRYNAFLEEKKAAEAARLAEEARKQREEAAKREAELREAEERKRAAEEAERKARAEAEAAERRREQARKDTEEAEARAKAAKEANEREIARQQVLAAKAEADRATIAKVEAEAEARAAKTEVREADRDATLAAGAAVRLEKRAERIEDKITDTAALSRTRGELGTVGSLARRWTYRVTDYDAIPLERLKPFLNRDAIDAAVYRLMQTGERDLPGVVFEQVEEARIA